MENFKTVVSDITHNYSILVRDENGKEVFMWQTLPVRKIRLNGKEVSPEEFVELLKSLKPKNGSTEHY